MLLSRFAIKAVACGCLALAVPGALLAGGSYNTKGSEYAITGNWPGDQVHPQLAVGPSGGYIVWEDNITDGSGIGISAMKLDSSLSGSMAPFRVNSIGADDQEQVQVSLLKSGGAVFVWQGGKLSFQHIYARFLSVSNTWLSSDVQVNASTSFFQKNPVVATLANSNVVVLWSSINQQTPTSLQDVYGQLFSASGQKIGTEFPVNQFVTFNQRTPSVAALAGGGFVVTWVSEQQRNIAIANTNQLSLVNQLPAPSVDIYARLYDGNGTPLGNEFLVNSDSAVCANPSVAAGADGGFLVAWSQKAYLASLDGWDIFARPFSGSGIGGNTTRVNTHTYGDQFAPKLSSAGTDYLAVWTSLAQDGSAEGVFGQFLLADGSASGTELQVNSTWISKQMHPAVSSDSKSQFLVAWTSFKGGVQSFDLYAQRFISAGQPLPPMDAPFVNVPFVLSNGVYQPQIQVSWPLQAGLAVDHYEVYVDGSPSATASIGTNVWTLSGILPSSTHSFQVAFVTTDGRRSPLSASASATTWGGYSWGGVPFEWMTSFYGSDLSTWPAANSHLGDSNGPTLLQVFLTGANPVVPGSWLRTEIVSTSQGMFLNWNPQPGLVYQVQTSSDLSSWTNLGAARLATGSQDSLFVGGNKAAYYRVLRQR